MAPRAALTVRLLLIAFAAALALPRAAPAMEVSAAAGPSGRLVIHASGAIRTGDADRFRHALDGAGSRGAQLSISSGGGLVQEAMRIARMVSASRVPVFVGDVCASACFLVFAASPDRNVGPSSRVGVHRAYHKGGGESAASLDATMGIAQYAASLGVPAPIVGRLVTTPGNQNTMEWLTADDLRSMNARTAQPAAAQAAAAPLAAGAPQPVAAASPAISPAAVAAGRGDRANYRRWLASLTDSGREGAAFWLKQRRQSRSRSCLNSDPIFSIACFQAQRWWAMADEKSHDPGYRMGWEGS